MADRDIRTYEVTFCSRVSKWADALFERNPAWNFLRTEIMALTIHYKLSLAKNLGFDYVHVERLEHEGRREFGGRIAQVQQARRKGLL
jgi:hypothetical protein